MPLRLVLAANIETLIGVAFVVISLISGLTNYLNTRAKPMGPNRGGRPVRPRSERIQTEIEQFMRDQVKRQDGDSNQAARPAAAPAQPAQRPAQRKPVPAKPVAVKKPAPRTIAQRPAPAARPTMGPSEITLPSSRPGEELSHRKSIASEGFGQGVRDHLRTAMGERVQSEARTFLQPTVGAEVTRHLGVFSGSTTAPAASPAAIPVGQGLLSDLRSREGMQKALLLQMILERPASLRRR